MTPPRTFSGTLAYEIIPRRAHHERKQAPPPAQPPSAGVNWHALVSEAWHIGREQELHGRLPTGISAAQFHAKVKRAAKRAGGEVGVQVRGGEWWIWSRKVGRREPGKAGAPVGIARGKYVNSRWRGLWEALRQAKGAPVRVDGVLDIDEQRRLRMAARRHQGMELAVDVRGGYTLVQQTGETR